MNFTVGKKLSMSFMIMLLIIVIVGGMSLLRMSNINTKVQDINTMWMPGVEYINNINFLTEHIVALTLRAAVDDLNRTKAENERAGTLKQITKAFNDYEKTIILDEDRSNFNQLKTKWQSYTDSNNKTIDMIKANEIEKAVANIQAGQQLFDDMQTNLDALVKINHDGSQKAAAESMDLYKSSIWLVSILSIVALLIGIAATVLFIRIISKPLVMVANAMEKVAKGDLTVEAVTVKSKDEISILARSCNDMVISLRTVIEGALNTAQNVAASAQQISASTEEIASGSNSQSSSAQTMNELFKELSIAVSSVAESAEQASELSNQTMSIAQDGGKVVQSSINGMNLVSQQMSRLEEDSNKIGEIIEVIDDIADQTNLLALNAAIEAARAGDQGRGFAVVADEVRKLAERSSEATKKITVIIKGMQVNTQQSVIAVGEGVDSSQRTGEAFSHIISMVNESAHKVSEIAAACEEQAAQSSEVLISIESISAATEELAASSEETAATAQSLAQIAEQLNYTVSSFKIN